MAADEDDGMNRLPDEFYDELEATVRRALVPPQYAADPGTVKAVMRVQRAVRDLIDRWIEPEEQP